MKITFISFPKPKTSVLKLEHISASPKKLIKTEIAGSLPQSFRFGRSEPNPRICIANRLTVDDSVGLGTTLVERVGQDTAPRSQNPLGSYLDITLSPLSSSVLKAPPKEAQAPLSFTTQNFPFRKERGSIIRMRCCITVSLLIAGIVPPS